MIPVPRPLGEELFGTRPLIYSRHPIFLTLLASVSLWPHEGDQKATSVGNRHQEANRESQEENQTRGKCARQSSSSGLKVKPVSACRHNWPQPSRMHPNIPARGSWPGRVCPAGLLCTPLSCLVRLQHWSPPPTWPPPGPAALLHPGQTWGCRKRGTVRMSPAYHPRVTELIPVPY